MRPSYVVMILVAAAVAAMAAVGPLRGRSVESGFEDVGGAIQSALSVFGGAKKAHRESRGRPSSPSASP